MVEVFKTDVQHRDHARMLVNQIHRNFAHYRANFDLEDCDRILRVKALRGIVSAPLLIELLNDFGFHAEVLSEDESPVVHAVDVTPAIQDKYNL